MSKKKAEDRPEVEVAEINSALVSVTRNLPSKLQRGREALVGYFRTIFYVHDLTDPQWRVLRTLSTADAIDATETSRRAFLLPSSLSRILRDLGARGLLRSQVSDRDARRVMLSLTPAGWALMAEIEPHLQPIYSEVERRFGLKRLQKLSAQLDEFIEALEADDGSARSAK